MEKKDLWTREQLLLALNLYCKIPFGQYDYRNVKVIELAKLIGRTPSAVAMQLNNFVRLDDYHKNRGISGLRPPGKLAQKLWAEAQNDWNSIALESETILENITQDTPAEWKEILPGKISKFPAKEPEGPTDVERSVKVRLGQRFFRQTTLANYQEHCCVCGIPIPELLVASHIIPWKDREDLRLNPHNGLCLCALHDRAFDRGYMTIDTDYHVIISLVIHSYLPQKALSDTLIAYEGHEMLLPYKFFPDKQFLETHRQEYFVK